MNSPLLRVASTPLVSLGALGHRVEPGGLQLLPKRLRASACSEYFLKGE